MRFSDVGRLLRVGSWTLLWRSRILRVWVLAMALLFLASGAIFLLEPASGKSSFYSFGDALWYGIVTMTTTGYGDYTPQTAWGRSVAVVMMLGGMSLLSLLSGAVASAMVADKIKKDRRREMIDKMRGHVLVCGWNQHAERVLEGLLAPPSKAVVLVNELHDEAMKDFLLRYRDREVTYVHGDPASESVLEMANVHKAASAIVLADASHGDATVSDERATLITLALKSVKANLTVTAEALDVKSEAHLRRAGADDIVITGEFNGFLLSSTATMPGVSQVVRTALSRSSAGLRSEPVPKDLIGRSFGELFQALRSRDGFLTLALVSEQKEFTLDDLLTDDYSLVDQFIKHQFSEAGVDFLRFGKGSIRVQVNPADSLVIGAGDRAIGIPRSA